MEPPKVDYIYEYQVWDCIHTTELEITDDTSFSEILVIISSLEKGLKKLERPIVSKSEAKINLNKIEDKIDFCFTFTNNRSF